MGAPINNVLTLVGKPLKPVAIDAAFALLRDVGCAPERPQWLQPDLACDIAFTGTITGDLKAQLADTLLAHAVDYSLQACQDRRRRLIIADMDSTIITVECIDEMADFLGLKAEIAAITAEAMAGRLDFDAALRKRAGMLTGMSRAQLQRAYEERVRLSAGAETLVRTMVAAGGQAILASGGFTFFVERVAKAAGFTDHRANELLFDGDRLTGAVAEPIVNAQAKAQILQQSATAACVPLSQCLAIGDGANDALMLQAAGFGIAYRAKPILKQYADAIIEHTDLTAALFFQGYEATEFWKAGKAAG